MGKIFLFHHCTLGENFWALCPEKLARLSKLPFTCTHDLFKETLFFEKIFFFWRLRTMSKKLSVFCRKSWLNLTKLRSTCPEESFAEFVFQRKFTFFKHSMTLSAKNWIRANFFQHGCQNYFLHVQMDLLKIVLFVKKSCIHFL